MYVIDIYHTGSQPPPPHPRMVYGGYTPPPPPCGPVVLGCGVARVRGIVCFCVAGGCVVYSASPPPVALWWPCGAGYIYIYVVYMYIYTIYTISIFL